MKNLLFIGVNYHGYTAAIIEEFKLLGYSVTYHDIEPWSLGRKLLRAVAPGKYLESRARRQREIVERVRGQKFDVVFFLQVHQFDPDALAALRAAQPDARFVLYNWDSVVALKRLGNDYRPYLGQFDRAFTFDRHDAQSLGIGYLPLFSIRKFQRRKVIAPESRSIYFVGNLESIQRYFAVDAFRTHCRGSGLSFSVFMACRARMLAKLLAARVVPRGIYLRSIADEEFLGMIDQATAVFDFANHEQTGFTMRVMENLCAGKKIITNNKSIKNEDFYTDDRIFVFDGLNFDGVADFVVRPITSSDQPFERYYIQNFAASLLAE